MYKTIDQSSYDFGIEPVGLIKQASRGLIGCDFSDFIKRAGHFLADKVNDIQVHPGERLIHVIGLGSTEAYGPNRNGDGFSRKMLSEYMPTFTKFARWYYDHCFVAGTLVVMADRTRKPIEDVKIGDMVATELGPRRVTQLMCNRYKGPAALLSIEGVPVKTVVTPNHPYFSLFREEARCRHRYNVLTPCYHQNLCIECREKRESLSPHYTAIESLDEGDLLFIPKPAGDASEDVTPEFAELVGWVASEGCLYDNGSIQFTFGGLNFVDIDEVKFCLRANGLSAGETIRADGLVGVYANGVDLTAELSKYIVGKLSEKTLTARVLNWSEDNKLRLLGKYIDGDGHVYRGSGKQYHKGQLRIRSSSKQMLYLLSDLIRSLGVPCTVNYDIPPGEMVSPTNGAVYTHIGSGVVSVGGNDSAYLCKYSRKRHNEVFQKPGTAKRLGERFIARIDEIEWIEIDEDVYNFEVEEAHHYVCGEVLVHNCNKDPAQSYGRIAWAGYNPEMQRGELIAALNATKEAADRNVGLIAERTLNTIDKGDCPPTSMSIKVPFDRCSFCDKIAKTRHEYCDEKSCSGFGCKNNLTKVASDGRVQFVHNDRGVFFDMSDVTRNADRISFALGELEGFSKAASLYIPDNTAEIYLPPHSVKQALAGYGTMHADVLNLLLQQEEKVAHDLEENAWSAAFSSACRSRLPACPVDLRFGDNLKQAMHALASEKIVLPMSAWLPLVAGESAASTVTDVQPYLPTIYSDLLCNEKAASLLANNPYEPSKSSVPYMLKLWAKQAAASFSLDQTLAMRRLQYSVISDLPPATRQSGLVKAANYDDRAADVALHYAAYTLAALQLIQKQAADFSLTCDFVVRQNWVR